MRLFRLLAFGLAIWVGGSVAAAVEDDSSASTAEPAPLEIATMSEPSARSTSTFPESITLQKGAILNLPVEQVSRVAIGDPTILDISVVSTRELLLQAKAAGVTNLIIWDRRGQRETAIEVIDHTPEATAEEINRVLGELDLHDVQVTREKDKVFLTGEVASQEDHNRLEQMLSAYRGVVTNLATVAPLASPIVPPPPSVKLTVQLIEMTRDATDRFGVDWVNALTFTETPFSAVSLTSQASEVKRLGEAFRLGALERSGFTATLNMLISQGKARILAEPKLVAASGKKATATVGVEVPIVSATSVSSGTVTQNVEFKQTGVELTFGPTVLEDGHSISLEIDAKVSSIDSASAIVVEGITVPGFRTRHTTTDIVTDSGQTVFIAGLLQDEERKNIAQLPGVGSIPVLGNLFRSNEFIRGQSELVIMVTPELTVEASSDANRTFALEQALASAEIAGAVNDPMLRYALQVQERVAKSIRYPQREKELGISGRVKLRLHLFRDGTLGRAIVSDPSGVEVFDSEALKAAEGQSPYPPFPSDLTQQDLWVELPVLFKP